MQLIVSYKHCDVMVGWNHHLMACAVMLVICWNRGMTSATASPNAPRKVELRKAREENWRKKLNMMLMMTMMSNDYANDDNDVDDNDIDDNDDEVNDAET